MERKLTVRCRVGVSRFGLLDRIRILITGRVFVAIANGKAHTRVHLTTRSPKDVRPSPMPIMPERSAD